MPGELFVPPKPPSPFVGRAAELEWLTQQIGEREIGYGRPIVVTGVGGIGKSALVQKYLESRSLISSSRGDASRSIRFSSDIEPPGRNIWIAAGEFPRNAPEFDTLMRSRFDERIRGSALVVLDGADEMKEEDRRTAFSHILNYKLVRALIVTSRTELGLRGERILRLDRLATPDAESLIVDLSQSAIGPDSMQKILSVADGIPLALTLLGALAKTRSKEELQQLLSGHLYDLNQVAVVPKGKLLSVAKPVIVSANKAMITALKKQPKDIHKLTPRQYEELVAELFRDMGYDVTLTQATRDGGTDILAAIKTEIGQLLCLIEAKHYREDRKVGVSLVRALYGTLHDHGATHAMMVTTSSYSKDAHTLQQRHQYQLSLKEYGHVADWIQRYGTNRRTTGNSDSAI